MFILYCPSYEGQRPGLYADAGTGNYQKMLATSHGARAAATFLQGTGLLPQFQLGLK